MAGNAVIGALRVTLGLDSANFTNNLGKAQREIGRTSSKFKATSKEISVAGSLMKGALAGFAAAISIDAITGAIKSGLEYASSLGEVAQQLGVSTKELQQYRYAASQVGLSNEEMDGALARLTRTLGQVAQGAKKPTEALERLGLSTSQIAKIAKMSAGDAIPLLADAFAKIENPAQRAAIQVDLFGKTGQKLDTLLAGGSAQINNLRNAAEKLGIVLSSEQIQKADDAADKLSALKQVLEARISSVVADSADEILALAEALASLALALAKAAKAFRDWNSLKPARAGQIVQNGQVTEGSWFGGLVQLNRKVEGRDMTGVNQPTSSSWGNAKPSGALRPNRGAGGMLGLGGASALGALDVGQLLASMQAMSAAVPPVARATVEGVRQEFKMLDGAMVTIAQNATGKTGDAFDDLRDRVGSLMDSLFPEQAAINDLQAKYALLDEALAKKMISPVVWASARDRLQVEMDKLADEARNALFPKGAEPLVEIGDVMGTIDGFEPRLRDGLIKPSEEARVAMIENFAQMTNGVLGSLGNMVGSIKHGDWLSALQSVVDVVAQVAGAFGGGGAFDFGGGSGGSKIPGFATGGSFKVGGLGGIDKNLVMFRATKGEMVDIRKPGQAARGGGGTTVYQLSGNLLTPEFWAEINQGHALAARQGASLAVSSLARQRGRALA